MCAGETRSPGASEPAYLSLAVFRPCQILSVESVPETFVNALRKDTSQIRAFIDKQYSLSLFGCGCSGCHAGGASADYEYICVKIAYL